MNRHLPFATLLLAMMCALPTVMYAQRPTDWAYLYKKEIMKIKAYEGDSESQFNLSKLYEKEGEYLLALLWHNKWLESNPNAGIGRLRHSSLTQLADNNIPSLKRLINEKGYDHLEYFLNDYAIVGKGGRYGLIFRWGTEKVPCIYDSIVHTYNKDLFGAMKGDKWGVISNNGKQLTAFDYDEIGYFNEKGFAAIRKGEKWGCIDTSGKLIVPCRYDLPTVWEDEDGEIYQWATPFYFHEGKARVCLDGKYGFVDKQGKEVVPCKYKDVNTFSGGVAIVETESGEGLIDSSGKEVVPCVYSSLYAFCDGLALAVKDGKYDYINRQGKVAIPLGFIKKSDEDIHIASDFARWPESFHDGVARVGDSIHGQMIIDTKGNCLTKYKYDLIYPFHNGLALARRDGKWGSIDLKGNEVEPCTHEYTVMCYDERGAFPVFRNNYVDIEKDGARGAIDNSGREVFPCEEDLEFYSGWENLLVVHNRKTDKKGVMDMNKNVVIPFEWKEIHSPDSWNMAFMTINEKQDTVYFDSKGQRYESKPIDPERYTYAEERNGKWGLVSVTGEIMAPFVYDKMDDPSHIGLEGLMIVEKNGRQGYMDRFGRCTLD